MDTCVKELKAEKLTHTDYLRMQYETVYGGAEHIPEYILRDLERLSGHEDDPAAFRRLPLYDCGDDPGDRYGAGFRF